MKKDVDDSSEYQYFSAEQAAHKTLSWGSFFRNFAAGGLAAGYKEDERSYIEQQFQQYESLKDQYANATTQKDKDRIAKQIKEIETYLNDKSQQ